MSATLPPPVAGIWNKANFPSHQPGLFIGFWAASRQSSHTHAPFGNILSVSLTTGQALSVSWAALCWSCWCTGLMGTLSGLVSSLGILLLSPACYALSFSLPVDSGLGPFQSPGRQLAMCSQGHKFFFNWGIVDLQYFRRAYICRGFPGGTSGKEAAGQSRRHKRCGLDSWVGKTPWRRLWQPAPVFLSGQSHEQRSLVGYGP